MNNEILDEVVQKLKQSLQNKGTHVQIKDPEFQPIPITKNNFTELQEKETTIAFVDGGNAELLAASNFSLQLVKVAAITYNGKQRQKSIKTECTVFIKEVDNQYVATFHGINHPALTFDPYDNNLTQLNTKLDPSSIINPIRKILEAELAQKTEADIIILDGELNPKSQQELQALENLYTKSTVAAIAKTNDLVTETGNAFVPVLRTQAPNEAWLYHPLGTWSRDLAILQLHKKARYAFKAERYPLSVLTWNEIAAALKSNASDPVFLGYPYGLIEADRIARITNQELEYQKTKIMIKLGSDAKLLETYQTTKNTHEILDTLSF
tara:strand:- start:764 stop:1735 length:972 start_codon:yes stop_codon:yes gene_type:complete